MILLDYVVDSVNSSQAQFCAAIRTVSVLTSAPARLLWWALGSAAADAFQGPSPVFDNADGRDWIPFDSKCCGDVLHSVIVCYEGRRPLK